MQLKAKAKACVWMGVSVLCVVYHMHVCNITMHMHGLCNNNKHATIRVRKHSEQKT